MHDDYLMLAGVAHERQKLVFGREELFNFLKTLHNENIQGITNNPYGLISIKFDSEIVYENNSWHNTSLPSSRSVYTLTFVDRIMTLESFSTIVPLNGFDEFVKPYQFYSTGLPYSDLLPYSVDTDFNLRLQGYTTEKILSMICSITYQNPLIREELTHKGYYR